MALLKLKDYTIIHKIGSGSFATVYRAITKNSSRQTVAIKCVDSSTLSELSVEVLMTEITLLKTLKHQHIVEMKDFFYEDGRVYIVMEYCNGGDLSAFIKKKTKLPEKICQKFLQQLALALKYLRIHNVSHMDLKPENLLLVKSPFAGYTLKVADFGLALKLSSTEHKYKIRGSPLYMAPEILLRHEYDARVDLWSVGVIMYECLFGKAPYSSNSVSELIEKIKTCRSIEIPKGCHVSEECKNLLLSLLKHDPEARISFDDFFSHIFLDLEHAPTEENYHKALDLVRRAVQADAEKNHERAYQLYCEALQYFIPLVAHEPDPLRKTVLRSCVKEYMNRSEKLKYLSRTSSLENERKNNDLNNTPPTSVKCPLAELRTLSETTPDMAAGLDIAEVGEQYLAEGNFALGLEKLTSALGILVRVLSKEPPGRRRNLLHQKVQTWLTMAENTKELVGAQEIAESKPVNAHEQCTIQ